MVDRDPIELKWRNEFDAMGEEGVREEFFKGTFQASQRKEASAYRWLGEKRKVEEKEWSCRKHRMTMVYFLLFGFFILLAVGILFFDIGIIWSKVVDGVVYAWKAISGSLAATP